MEKSQIGKLGEDFACQFLVGKGYKILERNYLKPWGEIDIVSQSSLGTLVFVEVKAMRQGNLLPEDHLTDAKLRRLQKMGELLANGRYSKSSARGWRIDLVALVMGADGKAIRADHYENIAGLTQF